VAVESAGAKRAMLSTKKHRESLSVGATIVVSMAVKLLMHRVLRGTLRLNVGNVVMGSCRVNGPLKKSIRDHRAKRKSEPTSSRGQKNSLWLKRLLYSRAKMVAAADVVVGDSVIEVTAPSGRPMKINSQP
jgi:hypothetical protein